MKGRNKSLLEAAKASASSARWAGMAVDRAHDEPLYALTMAALAIVEQLQALTLTIEASIEIDNPPE